MRFLLLSLLVIGSHAWWQPVVAQDAGQAPQPTRAEATQLIEDGDRLADQADYAGALEKYTQAYHEVVSRVRGQKFSRRVLPNLLTRKQLGEEMLKVMDRDYTADEWLLLESSYKVFGMMPMDLDAKDLMAKLMTEEVAGFYDPEVKRMVLIREEGAAKDPGFLEKLFGAKSAFDKEEQKTTLAHEMTHALQDQLYDLLKMQKSIEKDDDMTLAFSALVEGDATLLMLVEMDGGTNVKDMDPEALRATFSLMSFMLPVAGGATYRKAPAIFRDSLIFPYFQGIIFAASIASREGWPGIHAAYASPPTSTEQILHPSKYLSGERDTPQRVILPDLKAIIPASWQHVGGNCMGEFQMSILLRGVRTARRASEGWDGDRYEVYRDDQGRLAVVFVSVWDSDKDATQFAEAYKQSRRPKSDDPAAEDNEPAEEAKTKDNAKEGSGQAKTADRPDAPLDDKAIVLGTGSLVKVHGDQVWVIEGFHADVTAKIEAALSQIKLEEKTFPKP